MNKEDYKLLTDMDLINSEFEKSDYNDIQKFQMHRIQKQFPEVYSMITKLQIDLANIRKIISDNKKQLRVIQDIIKDLNKIEEDNIKTLNYYIPRACYCGQEYSFSGGECGRKDCW
jgi:hypothetical protein